MKRISFICLVCVLAITGCEKKNTTNISTNVYEETHTTNLTTYGYVLNADSEALQGIAIITEVAGFDGVDTAYSDKDGKFYSRIKGIPYPIPTVTVTALDPNGVYKKKSVSPHYMYECGTDFVPEKNYAEPSEEIKFVLSE